MRQQLEQQRADNDLGTVPEVARKLLLLPRFQPPLREQAVQCSSAVRHLAGSARQAGQQEMAAERKRVSKVAVHDHKGRLCSERGAGCSSQAVCFEEWLLLNHA